MKGQRVLLAAVILLISASFTQAQEGQLRGVFGISYVSAYLWRGFDMYPGAHGEGATQSRLDLDFFDTGFGLNIFHSLANTTGHENAEELDATLFYGSSLFAGETYTTDYKVGWTYYNHPNRPCTEADLQEAFVTLSWPEVYLGGIVPNYTFIYLWASTSNSPVSDATGMAHVFGLSYDLTVAGFTPETPEQTLHLYTEAWYNDGMGSINTVNVDHDWSHVVAGITTDFDLGYNFICTPGLHKQLSWDDSVNTSNATWVSLGMKYEF